MKLNKIWKKKESIFILQAMYARQLFKRYRMANSKPSTNLVEIGLKISWFIRWWSQEGRRIVVWTSSRKFDLSNFQQPRYHLYSEFVSRFVTLPRVVHYMAAKRILKYIKGMLNFGGEFVKNNRFRLTSLTNSNTVHIQKLYTTSKPYKFRFGITRWQKVYFMICI